MCKKLKKTQKPTVRFVGMNAEAVTGSANLISYKDKNVLLDYGYYQCTNKLKMYQVNARNLEFSAKSITEVIISHNNIDHFMGLPRLFKLGCKAKVFVPKHSKMFMREFFKDGLKIMESDLRYIKKVYGKNYESLYTQENVDAVLDSIVECNFDEKIYVNKYMQLRYRDAYHLPNSAQTELFIRHNNIRKKVLYTGDIGNIAIEGKPFLRPFFPVENADLVIGETTYSMKLNEATQKTRDKDIEKLKSVIDEVCIGKANGNVLVSVFANNRAQELLVELFALYGDDETFKVPIVLDSPLSVKITKLYQEMLEGRDKIILEKILEWDNLQLVSEWEDSKAVLYDKTPKVCLSASGFCEAGRIRNYLIENLPNPDSTFITVGYSSEDSLCGKIKYGKKTVKIDNEEVKNRANIVTLNSFSSHMQHSDLLNYYSDINCKTVFLVHGDLQNRYLFADLLEQECRKKCKTTKIYVPSRGTNFEF